MGTVTKLYVSNNTWIYVYMKKLDKISTPIPTPTPESFNSNSNSNSGSFNSNSNSNSGKSLEYQLQLQLQLREFQLQLQLRQVSWISTPTPTPTPEVSTPIPTPELELELNPTPTPTPELTPTLDVGGWAFHGVDFCEGVQVSVEIYIWEASMVLFPGILLSPAVQAQFRSVIADRFLTLDTQFFASHLVVNEEKIRVVGEASLRTSCLAWDFAR